MATTIKGMGELISALDADIAAGVMVTTMNTVGRRATVEGNRALQKYYAIKSGELKKAQWLKKASKGNLNVTLRVQGQTVPLYVMGGQSYVARTKGNKKYYGASAKPLTGQGRKKYPNTFPVVLQSGHLGMFSRTSKRMRSNPKRYAIIEHRMVTAATMYDTKGYEDMFTYADKEMLDTFVKAYRSKFYATQRRA